MSEGATISAPARAWETAAFASHARVASLSTSPSTMRPQWPWLVYSQLQTSVTTSRLGSSRLMARTARCTMPWSSYAPDACSSLLSGRPKSITPPMPSDSISRHSCTVTSMDICACGGMEPMGRWMPSPGTTKRGRMKLAGSSRVSRTRRRMDSLVLRRRGRCTGKGI